jgi:Predicted nucleotide-binding protein containing TIR-like domain
MKVGVLVRRNSRNVNGVIQAANIANRLQSEFEFDVEQIDWLQKGNGELRPKAVVQRVKKKHPGKHLIVVISPPLKGDYLDYARRGMNIVSTAGWDSRFAPPPLAIYLLFQFADAVASFVADLSPRQVHGRMRHNGFRACIFNSTEGRRRLLSVLIAGYVCADCRARLREWGVSAAQLDSIGHLLSYVRDFTIDKPRYLPNAVFIGHGRRADWEKIRNHISKKHGLKVEEFNVSPPAGFTTVERLGEMLESASFAILVMTAEDRQENGKLKARQNVVHEIGLFQGRLGFARAIVVKEDGVEEFSNIKGLTYIPFKKGKIDDALAEIDRVLIREHVIPAS